jgi:excinuclease ABC subunit A
MGLVIPAMALGVTYEVSRKVILPDEKISIARGGILPIGEQRDNYIFKELNLIAKKFKFNLTDPISKIPDEALNYILYGDLEEAALEEEEMVIEDYDDRWYTLNKGGLMGLLKRCFRFTTSDGYSQLGRRFYGAAHLPNL